MIAQRIAVLKRLMAGFVSSSSFVFLPGSHTYYCMGGGRAQLDSSQTKEGVQAGWLALSLSRGSSVVRPVFLLEYQQKPARNALERGTRPASLLAQTYYCVLNNCLSKATTGRGCMFLSHKKSVPCWILLRS
jgi:hypothetical protein